MFTLPLTRMKLKAKVEASIQVVDIYNGRYANDPVIAKLGAIIKANGAKIIESYGPVFNREKTKELKELDDKRDDVFVGIVNFIRGIIRADMYPEFLNKSKVLLEKITPQGLSFIDSAYLVESAILNNVIGILEASEFEPFISKINLQPSIDKLKNLNEKFGNLYKDRMEEKGENLKTIKDYEFCLNQGLRSMFYYMQGSGLTEKEIKTVFNPLLMVISHDKK
jgi:Family of unknown function (DUF6261)